MTAYPILITVDSRDRTLRHRVDAPPTEHEATVCAQLVAPFLDHCETLGMTRQAAHELLLVMVVEHEADEAAYRRVAEQRGVLAL